MGEYIAVWTYWIMITASTSQIWRGLDRYVLGWTRGNMFVDDKEVFGDARMDHMASELN